jgi:hypothetical protein
VNIRFDKGFDRLEKQGKLMRGIMWIVIGRGLL